MAIALALLLAACGPAPSLPENTAVKEPAAVTVHHVLIAFAGSERSTSKRTKQDAQKLAYDILARAKAGEDFEKLVKEFSDDPGKRPYTVANAGAKPGPGEFPRAMMAKGFGDVSFRISVGEIGMAEFDSATCTFGWHIIKRIK